MCEKQLTELGFWFFSTIVQSTAALLAILGAVMVFAHQAANGRREKIIKYFSDFGDDLYRHLQDGDYRSILAKYNGFIEAITAHQKSHDKELKKRNSEGLDPEVVRNVERNLKSIDSAMNKFRRDIRYISEYLQPPEFVFISSLKLPIVLATISLVLSTLFLMINRAIAPDAYLYVFLLILVFFTFSVGVILISKGLIGLSKSQLLLSIRDLKGQKDD
jgi:hypothetical protein